MRFSPALRGRQVPGQVVQPAHEARIFAARPGGLRQRLELRDEARSDRRPPALLDLREERLRPSRRLLLRDRRLQVVGAVQDGAQGGLERRQRRLGVGLHHRPRPEEDPGAAPRVGADDHGERQEPRTALVGGQRIQPVPDPRVRRVGPHVQAPQAGALHEAPRALRGLRGNGDDLQPGIVPRRQQAVLARQHEAAGRRPRRPELDHRDALPGAVPGVEAGRRRAGHPRVDAQRRRGRAQRRPGSRSGGSRPVRRGRP